MNRRIRILALLPGLLALLAPVARAADPAPSPEALAPVSADVQKDLDKSLKELAELRSAIEAEKIPLTKELTGLENRLVDARREHEEATRRQDGLSLESANKKDALKLRQDEIAYVGGLLDEFSRGFESALHVSEAPRYTPVLEAARLGAQNKDLKLAERLARQVEPLRTSFHRLDDLLGGARYEGQAVDPRGEVAKGEFAMLGPVVLFAGEGGKTAGLALPQAGSSQPAVRPLEEKLNAGAAKVVATGEGLLPVDPSRGGALKELMARGSLIGYFRKGGPIMYPLLCVSILALTVILERLFFLFRVRRERDEDAVQEMFARVEVGDVEGAVEVGSASKDYVARALTYALTHRRKSLSNALMRAANLELVRFTRGISILDTCITMAPLLGLLGTVTGMMGSFGMLGGAELSAPAQITGGIAEALIATAFGLGIAVTSLIPLNFLHSRSEEARHEMEDASTHLELLMKPILEAEPGSGLRGQPGPIAAAGHAGSVNFAAAGATAMRAEH